MVNLVHVITFNDLERFCLYFTKNKDKTFPDKINGDSLSLQPCHTWSEASRIIGGVQFAAKGATRVIVLKSYLVTPVIDADTTEWDEYNEEESTVFGMKNFTVEAIPEPISSRFIPPTRVTALGKRSREYWDSFPVPALKHELSGEGIVFRYNDKKMNSYKKCWTFCVTDNI